MKTLILLCLVFLASHLGATEIPVNPTTFNDAYANAADGDVLLMEPGIYASAVTFPSGKTITLKAAGNEAPEIRFGVSSIDVAITGGGLIFDGVTIAPSGDYFISMDNVGDIASIIVRNSTIQTVNRCFLRTNNAGYSIGNIEFTNCVIRDCGAKGWNFIYPKHIVRKVTVKHSTLYNYVGGESFFLANAADTNNNMEFLFENNTVYKWAKSSDRALCKTAKNYGAGSSYIFRNNIITEPGVAGQTPSLLEATGGQVTGEKNLVVNYGGYKVSNPSSQTIDDLTLESLGLTSIGFPDPENGSFTILSSSSLAKAGVGGTHLGDARWIKQVGEDAVNVETGVLPAGAGTVSPASITVEKGESVTLTATENYGFSFSRWQDASGKTLSTENPATLKVDTDMQMTAVFDAKEMAVLKVNIEGEGARWGTVVLSPEVSGNKYVKGSIVTASVIGNPVSTFMYWEDRSSEQSRQFIVDADKEITADFDVIPFIAGWDFAVVEPRGNRPGDYYFKTDNTGNLSLYNFDGSSTNWGGSNRTFGGVTYDCARRYTDLLNIRTAPRYFQARFSAAGYENIEVKSKVAADNECVHKLQKMQYSTDGKNFIDLLTLDLTGKMNQEWIDCNATLPASLTEEQKASVCIRWIPDTASELLSDPSAGATEGFYLANLFIYADEPDIPDPIPPVLLSTSPAEGSATASANGTIIFSFNEKVQAGTVPVVFNGETLTPVFGSKTAAYTYKNLSYGTSYEFILPEGAVTDRRGNAFAGVTLRFSTMERVPPIARTFDAVVAADGTGDFASVQAAVDAAPEGRTMPWLIFVKNGSYKEQVVVPAKKSFIHLIGQDKEKTVIHLKLNVGGKPEAGAADEFWKYSVHNPASPVYQFEGSVVKVNAPDFYSENISYVNDWGIDSQAGPQALAMNTMNDRSAFYNCKFRSFQDTWMTSSKNDNDRTYVIDSWIEGAVDYFYGGGNAYVENTTFYNLRSGSVIVAPCHTKGTRWGYIFNNCIVDGNASAADGKQKLGRPWQNSPITVYMNTTLNIPVAPEGWTDMGAIPELFAEYNTVDKNGDPVDLSQRKTEYKLKDGTTGTCKAVLTAEEVAKYTFENVICENDNWNPRKFIEKVSRPAALKLENDRLSWEASRYAICYLVFGNDQMIGMTTSTSFDVPVTDATNVVYQVKASNEYGSLSEPAVIGGGTGIGNTGADSQPGVSVIGNEVNVSGIMPGSPVMLVGTDGCVIKILVSSADNVTFTLPPLKGVFILNVGSYSTKIMF